MNHKLLSDKQYIFRQNDHFDVVYYNFFIVKSKSPSFGISEAINSEDEQLIQLLKSYNYSGKVYFDLFVSNGMNANNRFICLNFNCGKFSKEYELVHIKDVEELNMHNSFYKNKNNICLQNTLMCNKDIKILRNF